MNKTAHNSTYPKGGVSCSKDSFVVNGSLVFQIKFCGKSPALRVAANLSRQAQDDTATFTIPTKIRATLQPKSKRTFARQTVHCILTLTDLSDTQADPKVFKIFPTAHLKK